MYGIICVSVFSAFVIALTPASHRRVREAVVWLASLCLMSAICLPMSRAADWFLVLPERITALLSVTSEKVTEVEVSAEKWVIRYGVSSIEKGIQTLVASRFGLEEGGLYVEACTHTDSQNTVLVDGVRLYINEEAECDLPSIQRYVADLIACPCEIITYEE